MLFTYDDGHGISRPKREAAVTWFRKWFYNDAAPVKEGGLQTLTAKELFATTTGQVSTAYENEVSILKRNLALYDQLLASRKKFLQQGRQTILNKIKMLLAINDTTKKVEVQLRGIATKENISFQKLILRKENEIPLPVLVTYPRSPKKIMVWLSDAGKSKLADSLNFVQAYLNEGYVLVFADLCGTGETEDKPTLNEAKYYNKEYRNAMLALHIGKSLVAQRVEDIQTLIQFISGNEKLKKLPIEVAASGLVAVPALHAALLAKQIKKLTIYHSIKSYKEILENPTEKNWYSYVIPNILKYYDLADLVKLIGEKEVSFVE